MEHLINNLWFHDEGNGQISVYERIGRRQIPIRYETEGLPERLGPETIAVVESLLKAHMQKAADRKPIDVKISFLEEALKQFPNWHKMPVEDQEALKKFLSKEDPDHGKEAT